MVERKDLGKLLKIGELSLSFVVLEVLWIAVLDGWVPAERSAM